jgi:hypothetical protein
MVQSNLSFQGVWPGSNLKDKQRSRNGP